MRVSALMIAALLGVAPIASAQPWSHPYPSSPYQVGPHHHDRWAMLATHQRLEGHDAVRMPLGGRPYRTIQIQAMRGGAHITDVGVIFADGSQRAYAVNGPLDARSNPNLRIHLGRHGLIGVNAVVLEGDGQLSFRMMGS